MKITLEDKLKIIKLYEQGYGYPSISKKFNISASTVSRIIHKHKAHGIECFKHSPSKNLLPDIKLEIINKRKHGASLRSLEVEYLVTATQIYNWIKKYEEFGYNGLKIDNRGRPGKMTIKEPNDIKPKPLEESEREELIRLREENKQLEMENYLLKKLRALVQQRNQQSRKKK